MQATSRLAVLFERFHARKVVKRCILGNFCAHWGSSIKSLIRRHLSGLTEKGWQRDSAAFALRWDSCGNWNVHSFVPLAMRSGAEFGTMNGAHPSRVKFGPFEADVHTHEIGKHGIKIKLVGQP